MNMTALVVVRTLFALLLIFIVGTFVLCAAASAHDIYSTWQNPVQKWSCCGGKDCAPYPADKVKEVKGGWMLEDGVFVPYAEAIPSPDSDYHRCDWNEMMRCFAVPTSG